jgi:uncharacterized protein YecT (DUF1311 family)
VGSALVSIAASIFQRLEISWRISMYFYQTHRSKARGLASFIVSTLAIWQIDAHAAEFDCSRPYLKVDYVICSSSEAQSANNDLSEAWRDINNLLDSSEKVDLLDGQRRWIKAYGAECNLPGHGRPKPSVIRAATDCVVRKIKERIDALNSIANEKRSEANRNTESGMSDGVNIGNVQENARSAKDNNKTQKTSYGLLETLAELIPFIFLSGLIAGYRIQSWYNRSKILRSAGIRRHRVRAFASRFASVGQQVSIASKLGESELLWSFFLPEHRNQAKQIVESELIKKGIAPEFIEKWIPSDFHMPCKLGRNG